MAYVYILICRDQSFYIGSTEGIARRIKEHEAGKVISTKGLLSVRLVVSQKYADLPLARKVEKRLKKLKRRDYIEAIVRDGKINMRP